MVPIIVRLALATLCAILGGLVAVGLRRSASRRLLPLVFIALGTLLAVTLFDVLPDAKESLNWPLFLIAAASGYLLFAVISRYLYSICPACAAPSLDPDPLAPNNGGTGPDTLPGGEGRGGVSHDDHLTNGDAVLTRCGC